MLPDALQTRKLTSAAAMLLMNATLACLVIRWSTQQAVELKSPGVPLASVLQLAHLTQDGLRAPWTRSQEPEKTLRRLSGQNSMSLGRQTRIAKEAVHAATSLAAVFA